MVQHRALYYGSRAWLLCAYNEYGLLFEQTHYHIIITIGDVILKVFLAHK